MSKFKPHYFAGAVATALGINPVTLRMWRDRGYCDIGTIEEGSEDNPRARRRYTPMDACLIGVAIYLNRFGWSLEEAFQRVTYNEEIRKALDAVIVDTQCPDTIFCYVNANASTEDGQQWSNSLFLDLDKWKLHTATAFEVVDYLTGKMPAEGFFSVNVSAIARRVISALVVANDSEG